MGEAGQAKLLKSKVLLLGAGGLGSPAALYLAAAGVGTLGLVDADTVDASNLQRQIIHATSRVGIPKVESAAKTIAELNPDVKVVALPRAPDERQRRADLRRLRAGRRRDRQLSDPLPRERRERLVGQARRPREHLPLRRAGHDSDPDFRLICWVDSVRGVELMTTALQAAGARRPVEVCVEIGAGGTRTGCRDDRGADAVAAAAVASPRLRLVGVAGYEAALGHDVSAAGDESVRDYLTWLHRVATRLAPVCEIPTSS